MTQGIINVALPHIRKMWRKPAELSKKIEENANLNLKEIIRLLPISYPLQREVLGTAFHVGNMFQSDFEITGEYCYWELTSVIIPTAYLVDYLEKEETRGRELKGKEMELKRGKLRFQHVRRRQNIVDATSLLTDNSPPPLPLHPFSPANFDFDQPKVPKMTTHPATINSEDHISYCLSEFTLNTFASSIYDTGLCECLITDWDQIPGYLQRYISAFSRKEPSVVRIESKLSERPNISIGKSGAILKLTGWITVAADIEKSEKSRKSVKTASAGVENTADAEFMDWSLFHKTHHELTCRVIPRIDNDFVIKFAFEKLDCTSVFERMVSNTSGLKSERQSVKQTARSTMLAIVENMIIVELLPRIYEVGEVGIPLAINEGCLFETSDILTEDHALIISGFMRLKEFGKKLSDESGSSE